MADNVRFDDFSVQCINALESAIESYLREAGGEVVSQTVRNQDNRTDTGQLKNSWQYLMVRGENKVTIGSPLENALWEEFGTGEFALEGNGRKGGWRYKDAKGDWHFTRGKTPNRAFHRAFNTCKPKLIRRAEQVLKAHME